ncbi:MAG TPA: beta-L-arabinofuranosidase domain-containing protein [Steroidobacteraceae bacterium]|nr:beta-L-arabinofuranosidase domain-containing protein [Steroidobacteraceae bacterium]
MGKPPAVRTPRRLAHLSENCDDPAVSANITRRRMLLSAAAGAAALAARPSGAVVPQGGRRGLRLDAAAPLACREFDLADVTLLPGPFRDNMVRDLEYLASFDCDRLLAPFEQVAGLPARAPSLGGWESQGLASHYCGHYLSAAAMMYSHTRDPRLRRNIDELLPRLAACQEANGRNDPDFRGYCTGIPQSKPAFRQALAGHIDVHDPRALYTFSLNGLWSPWYTVHKIMAGLRDVWLYTGRVQARDVLLGMTGWAAQFPRRLSAAQMQTMLISEQGGMNEVLADVYAITGEEAHRTLAEQFNQVAQLAPLMRHEDILDGLHSNQYIPRVIGMARQYELTGSGDYRTGAEFFWRNVVRQRSFVFGGNGDRENFFPIGDAWQHLSVGSAETCCTYNMLKLTNHYFCWNASMEAADFYERALVNHILGSQDPATGGMTYYLSMRPGHFKTFSSRWDSCWCCDGTGMENHAKYARGIYYHDADTLWVNLYLASELRWRQKGLTIRQQTRFPQSNHVRLAIACARPVRATLRLRHPYWSTPAMAVRLNGKRLDPGRPGTWLELTRRWRDGDVIEIELRTPLRLERMPHHPSKLAILAGPTVLAAVLGDAGMPSPIPYAGADQYQFEKVPDPPAIPTLAIGGGPVEEWLQPDPVQPLVWHTRGVGHPADVTLVPFHSVAHERYWVYFDEKNAEGEVSPG